MTILPIFTAIIFLLVLLSNILLAFVVYHSNPKSATNILLALLSLVTSLWLILLYISLKPFFIISSLYWIRFSTASAVIQVLLFFLFSHTFPQRKILMHKLLLFSIFIISIFTVCIILSSYAFTNL
jgi:hypothetical protein